MNTTWSFHTCGASGYVGPTQNMVNSAYSSTNLGNSVTIVGSGIQKWIIPFSGQYIIECAGAKGGSVGSPNIGGSGAFVSGSFHLSQNDTLYILVGQEGHSKSYSDWGGGGGGGSYVCLKSPSQYLFTVTQEYVIPLIIAGGGGGAGDDGATRKSGGPGLALSTTSPTYGESPTSSGAGFQDNGISQTAPTETCKSFLNGGNGDNYFGSYQGGYGGGGRPYNAGGGGGGYHGGSAGEGLNSGYGGDSFINGTILSRIDGNNAGNGYVRIISISIDPSSPSNNIYSCQCNTNMNKLTFSLFLQFSAFLILV